MVSVGSILRVESEFTDKLLVVTGIPYKSILEVFFVGLLNPMSKIYQLSI